MDNPITEYATKCIQHKDRQLAAMSAFRGEDAEDIEQDLTLHLLKRVGRHDESRGSYEKFVSVAVNNCAADMIQHRTRDRRDPGDIASLDWHDGDNERPVAEPIDPHDDIVGADTRMDVEAVLATLPEDLRRAAELLKTETIKGAAEKMGIGEMPFRRQLLTRLRAVFASIC